MSGDDIYEACHPILNNDSLEEEDKTEKLEEFVAKEFKLSGKPLETAVLDVLWRFRNAGVPSSSPAITVRKSASPAPWQMSRSATPTASPRSSTASPVATSLSAKRPGLFRVRSSNTGSPFSSPRPSPSLLYAAPRSTQSPGPNPADLLVDDPAAGAADWYGEYGSDNMEFLVSDDGTSNASSGYMGVGGGGGDFVPGADWNPSQMVEMSPYDILRSVLREQRSDEEIERVLEANAYDLSAAIASFMEGQGGDGANLNATAPVPAQEKTLFVGNKAMAPSSRPTTPAGQAKSAVVCRYWLQTGQCLRADCRFSHDLSNHVCKYWLQGNCLAGSSCIFSHDPSALMNNLNLNNPASNAHTPTSELAQPSYEVQDYDSFPSLASPQPASEATALSSSGFSSSMALAPEFVPSRPQSRPNSRHHSPAPRNTGLALDDGEAFPALGAAAVRPSRKHHGKRGHGHSNREKENNSSNLLADVVRNAPNPSAQSQNSRRTLRGRGGNQNARENSAAAQAIPSPEHIPWLETGDRANKAYLKARQEAIKHGSARNKFLQSAAQAWHRQDVRAAKALSLRGQSENDLMREAHRVAADALYEERNKHLQSATASSSAARTETYIDLHGLHPTEAVSYLSTALSNQRTAHTKIAPRLTEEQTSNSKVKFLYAIVGTGHHSRSGGSGGGGGSGGKDKVGRAVRSYLSECGYAFREFSAPNEGKNSSGPGGGILGIDVSTGDTSRDPAANTSSGGDDVEDNGIGVIGSGRNSSRPAEGSGISTNRQGKVHVWNADEVDDER